MKYPISDHNNRMTTTKFLQKCTKYTDCEKQRPELLPKTEGNKLAKIQPKGCPSVPTLRQNKLRCVKQHSTATLTDCTGSFESNYIYRKGGTLYTGNHFLTRHTVQNI